MPNPLDIDVRIEFRSEVPVPASLVTSVVNRVDHWIRRSEGDDLEEVFTEFRDIPEVAKDAARYRLNAYPKTALLLEVASQGSLVLAGVIAAVSYWILDKTLGETISGAWQESDLHSRLKAFLNDRRRRKAEEITNDIQRDRARPWPEEHGTVHTSAEVIDTLNGLVIQVSVAVVAASFPPPRRTILNGSRSE